MKPMIKIMLTLGLIFTSTLIMLKLTGVLTVDQIKTWLEAAHGVAPIYVAAIVAGLLFMDLVIAVPTLTITLLASYFLGPFLGAAAAITGMSLAGLSGYFISMLKGEGLVALLLRGEQERQAAKAAFLQYGFLIILLSRGAPAVPEVSACMSGLTRMPFLKFLTAWGLSTVPYALIASYAGSVSSINNPTPAILAAVFLVGLTWTGWMIFSKTRAIRTEPSLLGTDS